MEWVCDDNGFSLDDFYGGVENEMIAEWNAPPEDDDDCDGDEDGDEGELPVHTINLDPEVDDSCHHHVALEYKVE